MPFIGFAANRSIVAQIYNGAIPAVYGPLLPTSPAWTHVVETWSSTTGLRLYVNNTLIGSRPSATTYSASGSSNYITLGNMRSGLGWCITGGISPSTAFNGAIDDFRIYRQVLTSDDVCALFHT